MTIFPFTRFEIKGDSMQPEFRSGDRVLVFRWGNIRPGDAIIFYKNGMLMVKRVAQKTGDRFSVRAANSSGMDSTDFGEITSRDIIGKVIIKY